MAIAPSLSATERKLVDSVPTGLFINGECRAAGDGGTLTVTDPSTGGTLTDIASAALEDGAAALEAAPAAQYDWGRPTPRYPRTSDLTGAA